MTGTGVKQLPDTLVNFLPIERGKKFSNNTGTTPYDSLQESYWADQKDSHNEVIMTS